MADLEDFEYKNDSDEDQNLHKSQKIDNEYRLK